MQKLSGMILDPFDDAEGRVMRALYPRYEDVPSFVKTAMTVSQEELQALPDDVFALVLRQGDVTLRKYACVDTGNTALNVGYFLATFDKLPVEAVKVAAHSLITACGWYDIDPPEALKKLSTGLLPTVGRQRVWKDSEGTLYGSDGSSWDLQKTADVIGTMDMPTQAPMDSVVRKKPALSVAKTAEEGIAHLVDTDKKTEGDDDTVLEQTFGITAKNPAKEPQVTAVLRPHVDVTDKEPPKLVSEKTARYYALPYAQRYPLDTHAQVKAASAYFDAYVRLMAPEDRHTFAVNLVKRAEPLSIGLSKTAMQYGQTAYAPAEHIEACIEGRVQLLQPHVDGFTEAEKTASQHAIGLYQELFHSRALLTPPVFARTLSEIDKLAGLDEFWDQDVVDPFLSTFYKTAEQDDSSDALIVGNEYMRLTDLKALAANKPATLRKRFSEELVTAFQKDPVGIFESLPLDQRLVLMRIANGATETRMA
jgi:hypothetical protein